MALATMIKRLSIKMPVCAFMILLELRGNHNVDS